MLFRCVCKVAKIDYILVSSFLSICMHGTGQIFMKFYIVEGWNLSKKFDFVKTNQTKIAGTLHDDPPLFTQENAVELHSLGRVPEHSVGLLDGGNIQSL